MPVPDDFQITKREKDLKFLRNVFDLYPIQQLNAYYDKLDNDVNRVTEHILETNPTLCLQTETDASNV